MKITQALLAEHVVFHSLFDHIERLAPTLRRLGEVRAVARLLESLMHAHSAVEDRLLIAPLDPSFQQLGQFENFHDEHDAIERDLQQLRASRNLARARALLLHVVLQSRKHFDKEERIVFPLAEKQLSARSQESLGRQWLQQHQ
jgi:hemerythrin-like domain-containing protein